ncbi:MAG: hypothetical protein R3D56_12395 [Paracoccaceae bacterium]|jgi:hypothetical protein
MSGLEVNTALLCDDVRREDNGKLILIGVYTGGIVFSGPFPAALSNLFVFLSANTSLEDVDVEFRLFQNTGARELRLVRGNFKRDAKAPTSALGRIDLPIPLGPIAFDEAGDYVFQMRDPGGIWQPVLEFSVSSNASP